MLLTDKTIIITGAGGGLGEGIARVCHREGATVVDLGCARGDAAQQVADSLGERVRWPWRAMCAMDAELAAAGR